jgi:hypothetical protein
MRQGKDCCILLLELSLEPCEGAMDSKKVGGSAMRFKQSLLIAVSLVSSVTSVKSSPTLLTYMDAFVSDLLLDRIVPRLERQAVSISSGD